MKYTLDKWRSRRFINYTIWNEQTQEVVREYSTQWDKNAKKLAEKMLEFLNSK